MYKKKSYSLKAEPTYFLKNQNTWYKYPKTSYFNNLLHTWLHHCDIWSVWQQHPCKQKLRVPHNSQTAFSGDFVFSFHKYHWAGWLPLDLIRLHQPRRRFIWRYLSRHVSVFVHYMYNVQVLSPFCHIYSSFILLHQKIDTCEGSIHLHSFLLIYMYFFIFKF